MLPPLVFPGTPFSWTNFSALPALFTGQRERDYLFFKEMTGALAPFSYLVFYNILSKQNRISTTLSNFSLTNVEKSNNNLKHSKHSLLLGQRDRLRCCCHLERGSFANFPQIRPGENLIKHFTAVNYNFS
jgi:hypothetical protein